MTDTLPDAPAKPILSACAWANNADMIADVFALHVKDPQAVVVDPTFGEGNFYTTHYPAGLIPHDKFKLDGVDWGDLPEADGSVDVVVFDPPFVSRGGRKTSTIPGMVDDYGMDSAQPTPEALWTDIERGIAEASRVLKRKGLLMLKIMPYVSSGHLKNVLQWAFSSFDDNSLELHDWFTFVGLPGPQPKTNLDGSTRRQVHSRNNASHLLVGRKLKGKK